MYKVNEIFYSIQGEGARVGTANVFIRFSGCNMECKFCDTPNQSYKKMSAFQIAGRAVELMPRCTKVILTGGEPCLQYDSKLERELRESGVGFIAMETNGSLRPMAGVDWVTCSPKVPEEQVLGNFPSGVKEIKHVIGAKGKLPLVAVPAAVRFLSPEFRGDRPALGALERCVEQVKANPGWRLTTQAHKYWEVR